MFSRWPRILGEGSPTGRSVNRKGSRPEVFPAGTVVTVLDLNTGAAREVADDIGGKAVQADLPDDGVLDGLRASTQA